MTQAASSNFLTNYAQQAKAIQRPEPDWLKPDLLYRGGTTTGVGYDPSLTWTSNYIACNAVQGARTFSADDLK